MLSRLGTVHRVANRISHAMLLCFLHLEAQKYAGNFAGYSAWEAESSRIFSTVRQEWEKRRDRSAMAKDPLQDDLKVIQRL